MLEMCNTGKKWYVFYTRAHAEKVVYNELLKRHYDAFLPEVKSPRRWKNRQKGIVFRVLFPGYIFVRTIEADIYNVVHVPKIVRCVKCSDRPAVVPDSDIRCIELMLDLGQEVFTAHDFIEGEHVRVVRGPLAGYEGILAKSRGISRFCIQLNDINQYACIDISVSMLEKVR
ncbi:MAG: UpxY family transcription antiterminator [Bacteroidales bacterium]|jgi:transcription antitermination factor NusG|nr:UpxY family transcription antiterminator [Bacteroidales bacterium]